MGASETGKCKHRLPPTRVDGRGNVFLLSFHSIQGAAGVPGGMRGPQQQQQEEAKKQ